MLIARIVKPESLNAETLADLYLKALGCDGITSRSRQIALDGMQAVLEELVARGILECEPVCDNCGKPAMACDCDNFTAAHLVPLSHWDREFLAERERQIRNVCQWGRMQLPPHGKDATAPDSTPLPSYFHPLPAKRSRWERFCNWLEEMFRRI